MHPPPLSLSLFVYWMKGGQARLLFCPLVCNSSSTARRTFDVSFRSFALCSEMLIAWLLASGLCGAAAFTSTRALAPDAPPAAAARSRLAGAVLNMEGPGMGMGMGGDMGMGMDAGMPAGVEP